MSPERESALFEAIRAQVTAGAKIKQMAKLNHIRRERVRHILAKLGLSVKGIRESDDALLPKIKALYDKGKSQEEIREILYIGRDRARILYKQLGLRKTKVGWHGGVFGTGNYMTAEAKADAERLARQIPRDTRDRTAILCGDPLPGRSALDRRQQA